jgi:hypothetical protein
LKSIRSGNDKPVNNEQVKERGALQTWADVLRHNQQAAGHSIIPIIIIRGVGGLSDISGVARLDIR